MKTMGVFYQLNSTCRAGVPLMTRGRVAALSQQHQVDQAGNVGLSDREHNASFK